MQIDIDQLPDDVDSLKAIIAAQVAAGEKKDKERDRLQQQNTVLSERIELLEDLAERLERHLATLKKMQFGPRSEKLDPDQLALGFEDIEQAIGEIAHQCEKLGAVPQEAPRRKRNALPDGLPREEVVVEPESKTCSDCGGDLHVIGEDVSERLDIVPAKFRVIRTSRPKYGRRKCENAPVQALSPPRLIAGGLPTEQLVSHVIVSKFADALPLYRQQQIYAREGVDLDRSTLADWVGRAAFELRPVHERLIETIKGSDPIFCDETHVPVLDPGRGKTKNGQFWAIARDGRPYCSDDPPAVAYVYQPGRCKESAAEVLNGYAGTAQVDGYGVYKSVAEEGDVKLSFCMAHVRRKFNDEIKFGYGPIAEEALQWIAELYRIETQARGRPPDERRKIRQEKAKPILDAFRPWLETKLDLISGRSELAKHIRYALNHWNGLLLYLDDGRLEIDSNTVERSMRPIGLTRKNALFAGHDDGARCWARVARTNLQAQWR